MKICISSLGNNLEAEVDPRFGRCQYFIIVDTDTLEFEAIQNSNIAARGGAGIQSGQLISNRNVEVVLTGNVGPNAYQTLQAGGIRVITGVSGKVKEAIDKFKKGEYKSTSSPTVGAKFGMGRTATPIQPSTEKRTSNKLEDLKKEAQSIKEGLDRINKRIKDIEQKKD